MRAGAEGGAEFLLNPVLARLGVSQRKCAKLLGVKPEHLARIYWGRSVPSWPTAVEIARVLGVPLGAFVPGDPACESFFEGKGYKKWVKKKSVA